MACVATLSGCAAAQPEASPATPPPTAPPAPRPQPPPPPPWTPAQRAALARSLGEILSNDILVDGAGIAVVSADGETLFARRANVPLAPASTLKLIVAASALNAFGPAYRFPTSFVALERPDAQGVLHGPLWLVGGGDPLLTSDELRGGVGALARAGVLRVAGPIVVDDSAFAGSELNAHWSTDDLDEGYAARTSALSLDGNTVEFHVAPGAVGEPAQISIEPPNDLVRVSGSILTGGPGSGSNLTINRATSAPASALDDPAPNDFRVDGRIETGEVQKYWKPVVGLPNYVGGALARMLAQRGIGFDGSAQTGPAPLAAQPLWIHRSQPLAAIVDEMLTNSNNHSAEQLLRILGAHAGRAGTDANGIAVERRELARLGISREGLRIFDGSGLSPDDRVEALTLAKLVAQELQTPASSALLGAMPRVGLDGTVVYHNLTEALGRARAKSGHIDGVNGLVGTVLSRHHGRIAFAFIVNDPRYQADAITAEEDHALDALADF